MGARDGPCEDARFNCPMGLVVDQFGYLVVADFSNSKIRYVSMTAGSLCTKVETISGFFSSTSEIDDKWHFDAHRKIARINHPSSVCVDTDGNIIVADTHNNVLRVIRGSCGRVVTIAGGPQGLGVLADGSAPLRQKTVDGRGASVRFNKPFHVMVDSQGIVHVLENSNEGSVRRLRLGVQCCEND